MAGKKSAKKVNEVEKMDNVLKNENSDDASENRKPKKRPARSVNVKSNNSSKKTRLGRSSKAKPVDYSEPDYDSEKDELAEKVTGKDDSDSDSHQARKIVTKKHGKAAVKVEEGENVSNSDSIEDDSSIKNDEHEEMPTKKRVRSTKSAAAKPKQAKKESNLVAEKKKLTKEIRVVLEHCKS